MESLVLLYCDDCDVYWGCAIMKSGTISLPIHLIDASCDYCELKQCWANLGGELKRAKVKCPSCRQRIALELLNERRN